MTTLRYIVARFSKAAGALCVGAIGGAAASIQSGATTPEAIVSGAVVGFGTALAVAFAPANADKRGGR